MRNKIKVSRALFFVMIVTSFLTVATISFLWSLQEINQHRAEIEEINRRSLDLQKAQLQDEVKRVVEHIKFIRRKYDDLSEKEQQNILLEWIASLRFGFGGYIFINTYEGQALIFDGNLVSTYKDIRNMTDPNGLRLFDIELEAAKDPNGKFMTYMFKRMDNDEPEPKMSYMLGYDDWRWIIGAGEYLNDLTSIIDQKEMDVRQKLQISLIKISFVFLVLALLIFISSKVISKYIDQEFNSFYAEFERAFKHQKNIKADILKSKDFTQIANKTNKLLAAKHKAEFELRKEKEFIEQAIDTMTDTFFVFDMSNGSATIWNQKFNEISGYADAEIEKMIAPDSFLSKQDLERFNKMIQLIESNNFGSIEAELITKSGEKIPTEYYASAIRDKKQDPRHIIVIGRDITERKKTEEELKNHREHLEKLVQERTKEIAEKNSELEKFNQLFIGRELRMRELKEKIKLLEIQLKQYKKDH